MVPKSRLTTSGDGSSSSSLLNEDGFTTRTVATNTTTTASTTTTTTASTTTNHSEHEAHQNNHSTTCNTTNGNILSSFGFYYLNENAKQKLPCYEYRGCDKSLLYHYILSPLAQICVDYLVPPWLAPNSITLIGLIWMMTAYGMYWWYVPNLEIPQPSNDNDNDNDKDYYYPPRWIFLWNGIAILAYQTLDNMDGKQARRTESSSPLGLLFDHGCDAVNSIFGSANWIIGMGLIPQQHLFQCWVLIFGPFALFYVTTWEQYHSGELILPIMNGPNEGLLGAAMLSLTSYWYGWQFWQGTEWYDTTSSTLTTMVPLTSSFLPHDFTLKNCDIVILASSIGFIQETFIKSYIVIRRYPQVHTVMSLLPFLVMSACFLVIGMLDTNYNSNNNNNNEDDHPNSSIWLSQPRTSLHLAMVLFVEMSTEIMLAHVTAQKFDVMGRWHLLPLIVLTVGMMVPYVMFGGNDYYNGWIHYYKPTIKYCIVAYTWALCGYLLLKTTVVIHEICNVLGIWCFDIVTPHPAAQQPKHQHQHQQGGSITNNTRKNNHAIHAHDKDD